MQKTRLWPLLYVLLLAPAQAVAVPLTPVPAARAQVPAPAVVPQPKSAQYPAGVLPLGSLGVQIVGDAPELGWAVRDLQAEWQTRLGINLPAKSAAKITIGTLANAALASKISAAGLSASGPEGYALLVDASGAYVVGADARGAYEGAQTLRQLLTPAGIKFARISDAPALKQRVAMIYLDQYSKGVNDKLIAMLAELKYNSVLVMSDYVQWDAARTGGYAHLGGATKAEARRVADLARSYGLEPIPLIETLGHVGWMFYGGKNLDLRQDEASQNPYAYDTLNPETYNRVVFPVLKEAAETFGAKTIHIGHDEVRNRDRFPARANGQAAGFARLVTDDITKIHDYLKTLGVGTMMWHDTAFADAVIGAVPAALPKDITVAYWNYDPGNDFPMLGQIKAAGFPVLGASWSDVGSAEGLAQAAAKAGIQGMIQTRWTGYFGNPSIWDGAAEQGVAYVRAANSFWNPAAGEAPAGAVKTPDLLYRDLYQPLPYASAAGQTANLSSLVTRSLTDNDLAGWINKGPDIDLRNLKTGTQKIGAYTFNISGAVMLKGSRAAAQKLPSQVTVEIGKRADSVAFLQTTGWPAATNREEVGHYDIAYADGSHITQPLEYGRHIRAWTDTLTSSMILAPGWTGQTRDGLDVNVPVLEWVNPKPQTAIKSISLVSEGKNANPVLIGLTLIGAS